MNNTEISYESHLITTQFRSGFYIYILDRSFFLMLYNITMIQHYSRCVIRQLLWLRLIHPNTWFRLGFYMCSLQKLSANWLLAASGRQERAGRPRNILHENTLTTDQATSYRGPEVQGDNYVYSIPAEPVFHRMSHIYYRTMKFNERAHIHYTSKLPCLMSQFFVNIYIGWFINGCRHFVKFLSILAYGIMVCYVHYTWQNV